MAPFFVSNRGVFSGLTKDTVMLINESSKVTRGQIATWLGWYGVWTSLLVALIFFRFAAYMPIPETGLGWGYLLSTWLGQAAFLAFLPSLFILLLLILHPAKRLLTGLAVCSSSLVLTLLILDSFIFDQYRFHINAFVIDLILNDSDGQIFDFSLTSKLMAVAGGLFVLLVQGGAAAYFWKKLPDIRRARKGGVFSLILVLSFVSSHLIHVYADALYLFDVTSKGRFFPMNYPATARSQLASWGISDPVAAEKNKLLKEAKGTLNYPKAPLQCEVEGQPYNVLVITIDSWRYDTADAEITPNVAAFSNQYASSFEDHHSGGHGTRTGIFSMFYGLPGTYWSAVKNAATPPVMMQAFQKQDYDFGIFASAKLTKPAFDKTVFASIPDLRTHTHAKDAPKRDIKLTEEWLSWLDKQQASDKTQPFFGFLFYDAAHAYDYPDDYPEYFSPIWQEVNYLALNDDFDPEPYVNRYKNSLHFTDSLIGRVLDDLKQRELLDDTVVVITSDHGQEFNDTGKNYWGHGGNFSKYQVQVPLMISVPGRQPELINKRTSHFDMAPTLLTEVLGCSNPGSDYSSGDNLFNRDHREWLISGGVNNYSIIEPEQITVKYHAGNYEIIKPDYNEHPEGKLNLPVVKQAMNEMSRFFK